MPYSEQYNLSLNYLEIFKLSSNHAFIIDNCNFFYKATNNGQEDLLSDYSYRSSQFVCSYVASNPCMTTDPLNWRVDGSVSKSTTMATDSNDNFVFWCRWFYAVDGWFRVSEDSEPFKCVIKYTWSTAFSIARSSAVTMLTLRIDQDFWTSM